MKKIVIILTLLAALLSFNCAKSGLSTSYSASESGNMVYSGGREQALHRSLLSNDVAYEEAVQYMDGSYGKSGLDFDPTSQLTRLDEAERKLIKQANVRIRVDNLAGASVFITDLLTKYNGYTAYTETDEFSLYYSLRIPSHQYDLFLTAVDGVGRLIRKSESTEDVTISYYDLESQLDSKRNLLRTYQSYLERAGNMEEILAVEYRLADLRREIEFTGTQLRNLANRIDYATVDLYLQGPAQTNNREETFNDKIANLFNSFGGFFSTTAVILLGIIIYGIPILAIIIFLAWLLFGRIGLIKRLWKFVMIKTSK